MTFGYPSNVMLNLFQHPFLVTSNCVSWKDGS